MEGNGGRKEGAGEAHHGKMAPPPCGVPAIRKLPRKRDREGQMCEAEAERM